MGDSGIDDGTARREEFLESILVGSEGEVTNEDGLGIFVNNGSGALLLGLGLFDDKVATHEFTVGTFDGLVAAFSGFKSNESDTLGAAFFTLEEIDTGD